MLKLKILIATTLIETSQAYIWTDISAEYSGNSSNTHWCWQCNCMWNFCLNQELLTALRLFFTWTSSHAITVPLTSTALHGHRIMFHTYMYDKYRIQRPEKLHFTHSIPNLAQSIYTYIKFWKPWLCSISVQIQLVQHLHNEKLKIKLLNSCLYALRGDLILKNIEPWVTLVDLGERFSNRAGKNAYSAPFVASRSIAVERRQAQLITFRFLFLKNR